MSLLKLQCENIQLKYIIVVDLVVWLHICYQVLCVCCTVQNLGLNSAADSFKNNFLVHQLVIKNFDKSRMHGKNVKIICQCSLFNCLDGL